MEKWAGNRLKIAYEWLSNNFFDKEYSLIEIAELMKGYNSEMKQVLNRMYYFDFDVPEEENMSTEEYLRKINALEEDCD